MNMKRLLVPTDFSPTAEKACFFALDIAKEANAVLILYHSFSPLENPFIDTEEIREQFNVQKSSLRGE